VGGALDYAHAQGVIHRDIKPSNILVDQWDNSLLTDFGLAKMVATSSHLTQTRGIWGTPAYMSPEQGLGQKIDHRSDIYSLGVVLYQMAVGHLPYQAETPMAVVIKHIHDPLPPPRQRDPNLPEAVELVILKALAKNPDDRYHTAGDLVKALEEAATTPTIQAAASPAADTAVAPPPPEPEPEPTPDPTPATVVMESASTAVAPPPSHTEPEPKPAPPPPSSPAHPPAAAPPRKKWRLTRRWVIAGGALLFVCCILFAIAASSQNRNGDNGDGAANEEIQATAEVAINEAVGEIINDTLDNPDLPEVAKARIAIALDAFREGNVDKALEAFDEAIAAAPENADIYCERGYIFRDMERLGDAVADFEKCFDLAQQQDNPEQANNALGEAAYTQAQITFNETDNLDEALAVIDPALEAGAPDWLRCERGEFILMAMGPDTAVIPDFEACAQTMTEDEYWSWRSNSILARVQGIDALNNEEYETAVGRFEEWANLVPDAPWPQCYLAYALDGLGDYPRAETAFQACHDLADDEETRQQAIGGLKFVESHIATDKGEMLEALTANQEAINLLPDDPW
ncbi:MAG: protein kinase, partial [Anaerolineae bacterium]